MGLDGDDTTDEVKRAAVLLTQLPFEARTVIIDYPDAAWPIEAHILRNVDYTLRGILYALCGGKGKKPKPIELPSERAHHNEVIDEALQAQAEVDEILSSILPKTQKEVTADG